jgi:ferredoxin
MNDVIFWFSGTGNTRSVAKRLADELAGAAEVPMVRATGAEGAEAQTVGIAFPVYYFGLPLYVLDFLNRVQIPESAYVYTVATMGGSPGVAHREAAASLRARGIDLRAGWSIKMPGNYTPLYGAPSERFQSKCFAAATRKVAKVAEAVRDRRYGRLEDSFLPMRMVSPLFRRVGRKRMPKADRAFRVSEHCTSCGVCEQVCPVQNLVLDGGKPTWRGRCQECMACLQWCPVEAIEAGWVTRGRRRYQHPDFSAEDFMLYQDKPAAKAWSAIHAEAESIPLDADRHS